MKHYSRLATLLKDYGFQFKKGDAWYYTPRNIKKSVTQYSFTLNNIKGEVGADNTGSFSCKLNINGKYTNVPMRAYTQKEACKYLEKEFIRLGLTKINN